MSGKQGEKFKANAAKNLVVLKDKLYVAEY